MSESKRCSVCLVKKDFSQFSKSIRMTDGLQVSCKMCNAEHRKRISQTDYDAMLFAQGGVCAICGASPETLGRKFVVDHAHANPDEPPRGILCNYCNTAIGLFSEDVEFMTHAIGYLQQHATKIL